MGNAWFRKHAAPSHAVALAVDDPLSAVQNAPHVCLCLSASAGYSAVPSPADSDALRSLLQRLFGRLPPTS